MKRITVLALAAVALISLAAGGAVVSRGEASTQARQATNVNLVVYSTPKPVMEKLIEAYKRTKAGKDVTFTTSYGGSSAQAAAVVAGQPADGVILSTGVDMNLLVDNKRIPKNWQKNTPNKGVLWNSVVVFGLRDGNPKKIKAWNHLLKPGVEIVAPNPFTAGIAKWNILGAYIAQRRLGKTDKQAIEYVRKLYKNVVSQDPSGSTATNTFLSGKGDVLLTFESEAINGKIPYVIPRQTMAIEIYGSATTQSSHKTEVNNFFKYLVSAPAQRLLALNGYRPVHPNVRKATKKRYPVRPGETKITHPAIGGWRKADKRWFDPRASIMQRIENELGVSTSG